MLALLFNPDLSLFFLDDNRHSQIELSDKQDVSCRVRQDDNPQVSAAQQIGGAPDDSHEERHDHVADAPLKRDRAEDESLNQDGHEGTASIPFENL